MKKHFAVLVSLLSLIAMGVPHRAFASSELDNEINDFQVQLKSTQKPAKPKKQTYKYSRAVEKAEISDDQSKNFEPVDPAPSAWNTNSRSAIVTQTNHTTRRYNPRRYSNANGYQPAASEAQVAVVNSNGKIIPVSRNNDLYNNYNNNNAGIISSKDDTEYPSSTSQLFKRVSLIPAMVYSSFDGPDQSTVSPSQLSTQGSFNFSGLLLADLNMGSDKFVIETGIGYLQVGAPTGYAPYGGLGPVEQDQFTLSYFAVPIYAKYIFQGEAQSSVYVKAGAVPMAVVGRSYSAGGNILTYVNGEPYSEYRLGNFNSFDIAGSVGIGYDYKINDRWQARADATLYQGFLSVVNNYTVYNFFGTVGIGISYTL